MIDHKAIIEEWSNKLELHDHNINIVLREGINNSLIVWVPPLNAFTIYWKKPFKKTTIIHELGHLYLAQVYNNMGLIKHGNTRDMKEKYKKEIKLYSNALLDPFVDYHLSKFEEYYKLLNKQYANPQKLPNRSTFLNYMTKYLLFYLQYKFVVKRTQYIIPYLNKIRKNIIRTCPSGREFSMEKFQYLDRELNKFKDIRHVEDSKVITDFMIRVLDVLDFWDSEVIKEYITKRFKSTVLE